MKTAILSDAHGNLPALQAVIDDADDRGVTEFWYLGDAVGYGPYPFQVWQQLQQLEIAYEAWLSGNHEWGLLDKLNRSEIQLDENHTFAIPYYNHVAWPILLLQRQTLTTQTVMIDHLDNLPVMSSPRAGVYLGHGAFNQDELICVIRSTKTSSLNRDDLDKLASGQWPVRYAPHSGGQPRFLALGHTHLPGIWHGVYQPENDDINWLAQEQQAAFGDLVTNSILVNPGSVGFSRDGDGCATYALVDWDNEQVEIRRIRYSQEDLRREMQKIWEYRALLNEGLLFECRCS
jgi:predicted phosphodiesterase